MKSRQEEILELIAEAPKSIKQISELLYIGEMTVRREIKALECEGLVTKYRGIVARTVENSSAAYDIRANLFKSEKAELAKLASVYLERGQTVFIDGSTTCMHLLPYVVRSKPSCVITNSLRLADALCSAGIATKMVCGEMNAFDKCVIGCEALTYIGKFNFDIAFLSAKGIKGKKITDDNSAQTYIRRAVIENSAQTVLLMDSSKFDKGYCLTVCTTDEVILVDAKGQQKSNR